MTDIFETRVENWEPKEDQEIQKNPQEKEKERLRLQCHRVQQKINQSLLSNQEILHSTRKIQSFHRQLQGSTCNRK